MSTPVDKPGNISTADQEAIAKAGQLLRHGYTVAFPTETVYGLGANALDPKASARIFEIKRRPHFDPLIVHVDSIEAARKLVSSFPAEALKLAEHFWPGPLTLVLPKSEDVPDIVTSGLSSVAVRVPRHPVALALLKSAGVPVAAPSANRFSSVSPTTANHVREELGSEVELILDGGPCQVGVESTIVSFTKWPQWRPALLRPGGISLEEIEAVIGPVLHKQPGQKAILAPGMMARHYAPRTPVYLSETASARDYPGLRVGLLTLQPEPKASRWAAMEILSPQGDLCEAAAGLFAAMRRLDSLKLDMILARPVPDHGLGRAINDRLRRAGQKQEDPAEGLGS